MKLTDTNIHDGCINAHNALELLNEFILWCYFFEKLNRFVFLIFFQIIRMLFSKSLAIILVVLALISSAKKCIEVKSDCFGTAGLQGDCCQNLICGMRLGQMDKKRCHDPAAKYPNKPDLHHLPDPGR